MRALMTKVTRKKTSNLKTRFQVLSFADGHLYTNIYSNLAGGSDKAAIQLRGHDCDGDQRVGRKQAQTLSDL